MTQEAEQAKVKPHPKARPTSFKKGTSGNPGGRPKALKVPEGLISRPNETQLEAMRWVLVNPLDETYQQWQMRQSLLADREKFLAAKVTLERAMGPTPGETPSTGSSPPTPGSVPSSVPDLGTEACLGLIEELMERYGEKRP